MMKERNIMWLNGNEKQISYLALDSESELVLWEEDGAFEKVRAFLDDHKNQYIFGWFGYDLKNDVETLVSKNPTWVETPAVYLMVPKHLARINRVEIKMLKGSEEEIQKAIDHLKVNSSGVNEIKIQPSISEEIYLNKIDQIKKHIQLGDIYEANFCYEFRGEGRLDPLNVYHKLNKQTKAPFSVFASLGNLKVLSASPERFIKKKGTKLFSQPIKGTIRRGKDEEEDQLMIEQLRSNRKDRSENIMIVDLVRNDLSKIAEPKSVQVEELCEIYTFENIHQMISTVSAEVENKHPIDIFKALFPMGSMTGAPKVRAMELIEEYEESKRGLYSGCIGYFTPNGDFDFNVVIRTIIYDNASNKFSFSVGGAITDLSTPEGEYEETLLKARAMKEALSL